MKFIKQEAVRSAVRFFVEEGTSSERAVFFSLPYANVWI